VGPDWEKYCHLGKKISIWRFFQGKNYPMIWAKFLPNKIGWDIVWAIFVVIGRFFHKNIAD
jgi:hypothetical protein